MVGLLGPTFAYSHFAIVPNYAHAANSADFDDDVNLANSTYIPAERISQFDATIHIQPDASITIAEHITYVTDTDPHHGIFRDIRLVSADGTRLRIHDISVTDEHGAQYPVSVSQSNSKIHLKIGDPDTTFTGEKQYIIRYTLERALGHFDSYDELYWNVTGDQWLFPIMSSRATVILPPGAKNVQSACYYGLTGTKNSAENTECDVRVLTSQAHAGQGTVFALPRILQVHEGLTVAVGFSKGFVAIPTWQQRLWYFLTDYYYIFFLILIPAAAFRIAYRRWNKYGRDPKGTGIIVAQYQAPKNLTPAEVGLVVSGTTQDAHLSAEIVDLAVRGFIKIIAEEKKGFFTTSTEFSLQKIQEGNAGALSPSDQKLMAGLFESGDRVELDSLKNMFYKKVLGIHAATIASVVEKKLYARDPQKARQQVAVGIAMIVGTLFLSGFLGALLSSILSAMAIFALIAAFVVSGIIVIVFGFLMPARTEEGVAMLEYILGLKEYLQIAEKDRIDFHNAPEKRPETFEKLLPLAMILKVEKAWAKEFADIYVTPPSWYQGNAQAFNTGLFVGQLNSFSTATTSSMASPSSSSSGSGGGGSSGGGGGGGGGGSW
jgi:uncharacterized membrane protein YgcG